MFVMVRKFFIFWMFLSCAMATSCYLSERKANGAEEAVSVVENPIVYVSCTYPGADAGEMGTKIVGPLEQSIEGLGGILSVTSVSLHGQCLITVEFEPDVEVEAAANGLSERISSVHHLLPRGIQPPTISVKGDADRVLVEDYALAKEATYNLRGDELFDDFLFSFVHDTILQYQRTMFPLVEKMADGTIRNIGPSELHKVLLFMDSDYTTSIYSNDMDMVLNEDTALVQASVEKIDLEQQLITSYDFVRLNGCWTLKSIRNTLFRDSELSDFLTFYSLFSHNPTFQSQALASSIRISMMDPEDDTQTIEGFITREQWSTIGNGLPYGIITNIRYGQKYKYGNSIRLEKTSLGNGMSETFTFLKGHRGWELVAYEN